MKHKVGDWVYRYIGAFRSPYLCEITRLVDIEVNVGFFGKKKTQRYVLQVPKQEWQVYGSDDQYGNEFCTRTQSELNSR